MRLAEVNRLPLRVAGRVTALWTHADNTPCRRGPWQIAQSCTDRRFYAE